MLLCFQRLDDLAWVSSLYLFPFLVREEGFNRPYSNKSTSYIGFFCTPLASKRLSSFEVDLDLEHKHEQTILATYVILSRFWIGNPDNISTPLNWPPRGWNVCQSGSHCQSQIGAFVLGLFWVIRCSTGFFKFLMVLCRLKHLMDRTCRLQHVIAVLLGVPISRLNSPFWSHVKRQWTTIHNICEPHGAYV